MDTYMISICMPVVVTICKKILLSSLKIIFFIVFTFSEGNTCGDISKLYHCLSEVKWREWDRYNL